MQRVGVVDAALKGIPSVRTEQVVPPIANHVPHMLIHWDENQVKITRAQMKQKLAKGNPPITTARVHGTGEAGFLISVFMLQPGEDQIVAKRIRDILKQAVST